MHKMKKFFAAMIAVTFAFGATGCLLENTAGNSGETEETYIAKEEIKNVILLIGDGMGPNQIQAGELYKGEPLFIQTLKQKTYVETRSANQPITDSAAAATAIATGVRTNNGVVGYDPEGNELQTIVDIAKANNKSTGVITTEELYGATPMGFSAHASARGNTAELMMSAATTSNVNLFASYTFDSTYAAEFSTAGYEVIAEVDDISVSRSDKVFGMYNILASAPSMSVDSTAVAFDRVVTEALDYLAKDPDGFFLMAEGAHIDHGGHNNDLMYMLRELLAFDDMVKAVVQWAKARQDTLVLVTADHETGGLVILSDATEENMFDTNDFVWTTTGHSDADVCFYAYGPKIDFAAYSSLEDGERIRNIDIIEIMKDFIEQA